jgi:hypothetical protein
MWVSKEDRKLAKGRSTSGCSTGWEQKGFGFVTEGDIG